MIWFFVLADMLDGAMARERSHGSRSATRAGSTRPDQLDGAVFAAGLVGRSYGLGSKSLVIATVICLQFTSRE